jgi:hypothetical protein
MTSQEFELYLSVLQQGEFEIRPDPTDTEHGKKTFQYVSHTPTDVTIQHVATPHRYLLPLALVGLIIPGTMWLNRQVLLTDYYWKPTQ